MADLTYAQLHEYIANALRANRISDINAESVAHALSDAERDGQLGHGVSRVPSYCAQARSGKVNGNAQPNLQLTGATIRIDACHGFAYPALDLAIPAMVDVASEYGVAVCGIYNSHHSGVAGLIVERLAERGVVALMMANTPAAMVPQGGKTPVFGTNPIAFSCPRGGQNLPLVIDLSLSEVARGKVMLAAREGREIPLGWGLNSQSQPTTDPNAVLNGGSMIPIAGAKGSALALMVELLAAALVGANPGFQATSFLSADGRPPGVGQWLLALNPAFFSGTEFLTRVETIVNAVSEQPGARLPGQSRIDARSPGMIWVADSVLSEIRTLANASNGR
jgi:(2R)-3-sulfolactate dehydrogenase (NADP+)